MKIIAVVVLNGLNYSPQCDLQPNSHGIQQVQCIHLESMLVPALLDRVR